MNVTKCDWCGNETLTPHAEEFWFHLSRPVDSDTNWSFDKESCLALWAAQRAPEYEESTNG